MSDKFSVIEFTQLQEFVYSALRFAKKPRQKLLGYLMSIEPRNKELYFRMSIRELVVYAVWHHKYTRKFGDK